MLNTISNFITSNPIGRIFGLGGKTVEWKKVNELKPGMKIAIAPTSLRGGTPTWQSIQIDPGLPREYARNDKEYARDDTVEWDEIVSIKSVGREQVYDIEVEGTHNFVGNGIVAHNTLVSLSQVISELINRPLLSPVAEIETLKITSKLLSPLAEIDTIYSSTISAETASISGTLYAANIESPTIDLLSTNYQLLTTNYATASAILAAIRAKYDSFDSLTSPAASPAADPLSTTDLANFNVVITDSLMVNTSLISNSINSNDTALYIQPTANQPINLLAGLMTLSPDGQVVINGDLTVTGNLSADKISLYDLVVASPATGSATATDSATLASNASIGTGTIASGSAEVKIENSKIVDSTYIYLTPISDTANQVVYVKNKTSGSFTVGVNATPAAEILFNYWLIQTEP